MKEQALADYYLGKLHEDAVNVLGLHAEIRRASVRGLVAHLPGSFTPVWRAIFAPLEIAQQERARATADEVVHWEIPGRAGTVACQKATA